MGRIGQEWILNWLILVILQPGGNCTGAQGFGTLEQRVNERSREDVYTFDLSANIDAGKLLPKKLGIQIPVYAGISRIISYAGI